MKKRIVNIGAGHGTASLNRYLKKEPDVEITSIVAVTDGGGSSGIIRAHYNVVALGDLRIVISSLIPDNEEESFVGMEHRIESENGHPGFMDGHPMGNIRLLGFLQAFNGDIVRAIKAVMKDCRAGHTVLPVTSDNVHLVAHMNDGSVIEGEGKIDSRLKDNPRDKRTIVNVSLSPEAVALPEVEEAIDCADLLVVNSGSLFSSILPNFCVKGVVEAIRKNRKAKLVQVVNLVTNKNETPDWKASQHVRAVFERTQRMCDYVICHEGDLSPRAKDAYKVQGSTLVEVDDLRGEDLPKYTHNVCKGNFIDERPRGAVRHNAKLAHIIANL